MKCIASSIFLDIHLGLNFPSALFLAEPGLRFYPNGFSHFIEADTLFVENNFPLTSATVDLSWCL
jgi:hypothetical protein